MAQGQGGNNFNNQQNFQNQNQNHNQHQDSKPQMRGGAIKDEHATLKEKVQLYSSTLFPYQVLSLLINFQFTFLSLHLVVLFLFYHKFYSFDALLVYLISVFFYCMTSFSISAPSILRCSLHHIHSIILSFLLHR
jgi:hypothetical protein